MVSTGWFESVAQAQKRAKRLLPHSVYGALIAGSEQGVSYRDNLGAFAELGLAPKVADLPAERAMARTVLGQDVAMPVLLSPTGVQAVHPDGEVAVARAAAARGVAMGLSSFASKPIEEVVPANPRTLFQMYWLGSRDDLLARLERARTAGAVGIILTLDWSFSHGRDWGSPSIPEKVDLKTMAQHALPSLAHPQWLGRFLRAGELPDLTVPNVTPADADKLTFFGAYGQWMGTPPPTWEDVAWLRSHWDGPFMVKGICRVDEAKNAVQAGVSAISVSNHGGNNIDSTPAPIRTLPAIAEAVGDDIEVLLDSGIRRGSDVVKALAMGAKAVMIGRAYLWGLAVNGQAGVENVLDILRGGMDSTLRALGKASIDELGPDDVIVPDGFLRRLGDDAP